MKSTIFGFGAAFLIATPSYAASTTANFNVTITILKQCTVTAPATIALGSKGANDLLSTTASATQSYSVTCSKGTGYTIGFASSNDVSAGSQTHQMKGTGSNTDIVQYNLFDATTGGTTALDGSTHVISDTGTGTSQSKSLKAQVVNYTTAVTPDVYTDTVTMTVTYGGAASMRNRLNILCLATALVAGVSGVATAAALRVSPILVDAGPAMNTTMTLTNNEARPIDAQVRVFRWSQHNGQDELVPTDDVVASPPIVSIPAHEEYVVRLQHVGREPVGEEAYRIVVDELPNPNRQRNGTVAVVLRYIVPAFFYSPDASQSRIRWSIGERDGRSVLVAQNAGDKRIQMNNLALKAGGQPTFVAKGLAGYVLGHSSKEWPLSARLASVKAGTVVATSDVGAVNAPLAR